MFNMSDRLPMDAESSSYLGCADTIGKHASNSPNIRFAETDIEMFFSPVRSSVPHGVLAVLNVSSPSKIVLDIIAFISILMRNLVVGCGRWSVKCRAHENMHIEIFTAFSRFGRRHHGPVVSGIVRLFKDLSSIPMRLAGINHDPIDGSDTPVAARLIASIAWYRAPFFGYRRVSHNEVRSRLWSGALDRFQRLSAPHFYYSRGTSAIAIILALVFAAPVAMAAKGGGGGGHHGGGGAPPGIVAVNLSGNTFTGGASSGTVVGTISVVMTTGSFTGSLSLTGANASSFQLVGSNLETNGTVAGGSYSINIVATQGGASASPFTQAETITGVAITAVNLSGNTFVGGSSTGTIVGAISVVMASGSFTGSLSLTGANASSFQIVGSNLETNGVVANGTYSINIIATQAGAGGSPFTQPETITGISATTLTERFVGPFSNWLCVRTLASGTCGPATGGYGTAVGDGSANDTAAIQSSLNALGSTHPVLYFPAGTYKITSMLTLTNTTFMSIVGATPAPTCSGGVAEANTVCIVWGGAANSKAMLDLEGDAYVKVDRLTFNGLSNVGVFIVHNYIIGQPFPTGGEFADDVFINAGGTYNATSADNNVPGGPLDFACGFILGTTQLTSGGGCSEVSLLRDHFTNGSSGIGMGNQNAGNMWVWYSTFTNKAYGLWEHDEDYHVYNSNFFNSSVADLYLIPAGDHVFAWNYSSGSNQFLHCVNWGNNALQLIEGNIIVNTTNAISIECDNQGPIVLIDNVISSCTIADGCGSDAVAPAVKANQTTYPNDLLSTGNRYTIGTANDCVSSSDAAYVVQGAGVGRCHALGDSIVAHSHPAAPTLPGTPPQYCASGCPNTVTVTEITAGSSTATIQSAINTAAALNNGAVVHLQAGSYTISTALSVPGNEFVQIIGDGIYTVLNGSGGATSVITCGSACKAWFRDFQINGASFASKGITFTGADQAGGRVFMEQLWAAHNNNGVLVNGLAHSNVEVHDSQLTDILSSGDSINVVGPGGSNASYTNLFNILTSCNNINFARTSSNANFTLRHLWSDLGGCAYTGSTFAQVTGSGTFSLAGAHAYVGGSPPGHYFNLTNFSGISAIIGVYTLLGFAPADEVISGSLAGQNLVLGYMGCNSPVFTDTATGDAYALIAPQLNDMPSGAGCDNGSVIADYVTEARQNVAAGDTALLSFLNTTLAPLRIGLPTVPGATGDPALASSVTDARVYRVLITATPTAIAVLP